MPVIGDFQFKGGLSFPAGAAAALYPKPITSPRAVVAGTSVKGVPAVQDFSLTNNADINTLAVDINGDLYLGYAGGLVRKVTSAGADVWSFSGHISAIFSLATDLLGNTYSSSYDNTIRKIDSSGGQVWSATPNRTKFQRSVAADLQGNVYCGGDDYKVYKYNSSGTQVWAFSGHTKAVQGVAVDPQGNVYSAGSDKAVFKISPTGTQVYNFVAKYGMFDVKTDPQGNAYCCNSDGIRKLNSDGTIVWSTTAADVIAVDPQGTVYAADSVPSVRKFNSTGTQVWRRDEDVEEPTSGPDQDTFPMGIAIDLLGNVYCCNYEQTVYKLFDGRIIHTS